MTRSPLIAELTWVEFRDALATNPMLFLPVGSLEQHGPHLPLATDVFMPMVMARAVALATGSLVAPPLPYGFKSQPKSGGGQHFPGTVSLDGATLIAVVRDVLVEFARHGARRLVVLDGHMENQWFLVEAIDLALRHMRWEGIADARIVKINYWDYIDAAAMARLFDQGFLSWELEHAAVMETSVMLHAHPDLCRADRIPDEPPGDFPAYDRYPVDTARVPACGALSSAKQASADKGRLVVESVVAGMVAALVEAFA